MTASNIPLRATAACLAGSGSGGIPGRRTTAATAVWPALIHTYFPQFTADPALDYPAGAIGSFPNGVPWYNSVAEQTTEGASNYNSLQVSLIKAASHGLYFSAAYTYSVLHGRWFRIEARPVEAAKMPQDMSDLPPGFTLSQLLKLGL